MHALLIILLVHSPLTLDKGSEEALDNNQSMLESIITFHAIAEGYTQAADGKFILTAKSEQWKRKQLTKTTEHFNPIKGGSRKTIALSSDGLSHILYLPNYPPVSRAQKMGHMLMPGSIYWQLGYCMSDDPNKRSLSPSEMLQAGYSIISSKVEGKPGERDFTIQYNHNCSIVISEKYNFLLTNLTESSKGYSLVTQASEIKQVVPGIYVPFKITREEKIEEKVSQRSETRVKSVEINQPIDDSKFKLNMEPGGTMTDFTTGKGFFVDSEGGIIKENPAIRFTGTVQKPSSPVVLTAPVQVPSYNFWRFIGIALGCLLLIASALILIRKKAMVH